MVALGVACAGGLCGMIGPLLAVRRLSLFADLLGHSVFPGVAAAVLILGLDIQSPWILAFGIASAALSSLIFDGLSKRSSTRPDAALAITLSGFYAFGVLLLAELAAQQKGQGLQGLLLGQGVLLDVKDLLLFAGLWTLCGVFLGVFWKPLVCSLFDPFHGKTMGKHPERFRLLVTLAAVVATLIALRSVGAILASALFLIPTAASLHWCQSLSRRVFLASALGFMFGGLGTWVSTWGETWPLGPVVVLTSALFLGLSQVLFRRMAHGR